MRAKPVKLPLGRERGLHKTHSDRIAADERDGNPSDSLFDRECGHAAVCHDDIGIPLDHLSSGGVDTLFVRGVLLLDDEIIALDVSGRAQALAQRLLVLWTGS